MDYLQQQQQQLSEIQAKIEAELAKLQKLQQEIRETEQKQKGNRN